MGLSLRIFIVEDDDTIHRLPLAKYDRLLEHDSNESLPRYAGNRVRYALVVVNLYNRKPIEILKFQYSYLSFDAKGRLDPDIAQQEARLAFDVLGPYGDKNGNVIEARHLFAKKRFRDKYTWTASPEVEAAIVNEIFGVDGKQ